jgi:hypothetical protein
LVEQLRTATQALYNDGLWSNSAGPLALVAIDGSQAPGTANVVYFEQFYEEGMATNGTGNVAFAASLAGNGVVDLQNDSGIWSNRSGSIAIVTRAGDPAPGAPNGSKFGFFSGPVLSDSGRVAFIADTFRCCSQERGVWFQDSGALTPLALTEQQAPGLPDGVLFSNISRNVAT